MSDLISRSELIEIIKGTQELLDFQKDECIDCINSCDIAYDIDKVVEEMDKATQYIKIDGKPTSIKAIHPEQAIEIVKQGSVSDDMCEWKLEDEESNLYATGCEQRHLIFYETPKENGYKFCPYCGKKLKESG